MRIAFYTIALNEEAHCERWCASTAGADARVVLDTGSTDATVKILKSRGVRVERMTFDHWRFDTARNAALDLLPADVDVCVSLDMDESPDPGWRDAIESVWTPGATRLRYSYVFDFKPEKKRQTRPSGLETGPQRCSREVHSTVFTITRDGLRYVIFTKSKKRLAAVKAGGPFRYA